MTVHVITRDERRLLQLFLSNSRAGITTLAQQLGRGRNWVARTIRRLVQQQVVRAYTTVINPLGGYIQRSMILLVKTNPRETHVSSALLSIPGLESLDGVTGEHSLLGLFRIGSAESFSQFLDLIDGTISRSSSESYSLVQVLTTYKTQGFVVVTAPSTEAPLSPVEVELLRVIRRHVPTMQHPLPLTQREIGLRMRRPLSQPAVSKTVRRLEELGVILGYSAEVSFDYLGRPIKFFLQIRPSPGTIAEAARRIASMDEVWDLHRTSESFSLFATVRCASIAEYNRFLRRLYEDENILDTRSHVSLEEWTLPTPSQGQSQV